MYYHKALAIDTELGDRIRAARSYHQLGIIEQARGDYAGAQDYYRRALETNRELGDQRGVAKALSQIGTLLTESGRPADAITFTLESLAIRAELQSPDAQIDVHWLSRQREILGEAEFNRAISRQVGSESVSPLNQLLNDQKSSGTEASSSS